jgi:aspartyl-tRNA(Asn)/glutamyl-tRNA(Gln) amidotransferase subunit A
VTDVTRLTITEASDLLRRRAISAVELTEATLQRLEATEPIVHAYALVLAERARRSAYHADRELAQGRWRGPLHGIPVGVKDICSMRDLPNEAGSRVLAGFVPGYDATVVRRLDDAGAVIVGKTVAHEFAYGVNTPPTRTPWNLECYPGGSSAGSGVAVTVGSAFAAIGTDTGGSIRNPAAINGIIGLKPTYGRVSRSGVIPLGTSLDHVGPLTRTVADCAIVLQATAGYDLADRGSVAEPVPDYRSDLEAGVRGRVIGVERQHFFYPGVTEDVRRAVEAAIDEYQALGATIVEVELPELAWSPAVLMTILAAEASTVHRRWLREQPDDYDPATRRALELGEFVPATHYLLAQRARALLRQRMANMFSAYRLDALLSPTVPMTTVPLAERFAERPDFPGESPSLSSVHHTFSANLTGQPALSIPCGLSSAGLPIGFQLLGRPFAEANLFQIARAYEREHGWSSMRPEIDVAGAEGSRTPLLPSERESGG